MIVVSDTSPLRYLVVIEAIEILPEVFGRVYAPPEVLAELKRSRKTELDPVRAWASSPPEWLTIQVPAHIDETLPEGLGRGEVEAISLAQELRAEKVLIDDRAAREAAEERKLGVAGTLGVLGDAANRGLIDIELAVQKLRETNFRATEPQYRFIIERVRQQMLVEEQPPPEQNPSTGRKRRKR